MISFKHTPLKDFVKKYNPSSPELKDIEAFQLDIKTLLQEASQNSKEKSQEKKIEKLLERSFSYSMDSIDNIDSTVLVDNRVNVIIEVKAVGGKKKDFITSRDFPLAKAFAQAIFYFLKERDKGNNFIKHIIVCTYREYYVYDAQHFIQFEKDKEIGELFKGCKNNTATDTGAEAFYKSIQEYLKSPYFIGEIPYTYFSLSDNLSIEELSIIYQLLSPQVLLKVRKTLDANTLNKDFYEELLYILGLQEVSESGKSGGKIIIKPSSTPHTLSSEILRHYGLDEESTFTLITTWNNRILFLRLLESMLLGFKHIQKRFLDTSIIKDFKTLQTLFFEVLAKKEQERSTSLPKEFLDIPYLNSSLFDRIALEQEGKVIGGLDSCKLPLFSRSILKKNSDFKDKDSLPLLEYLFEFLRSYNFTTTPKDISQGVKQNHDKLINPAVLGLVFEKLNGYKEGSFYTPSFITSYMCKESITQAVIEKFNQAYKWRVTSLKDIIRNAIRCKLSSQELLSTLLSLRICDPSVGSGHFLVSALNEIIRIAYDLGLIPSFKNNTTLKLENDEIIIKTQETIHQYTKPDDILPFNFTKSKSSFSISKNQSSKTAFLVWISTPTLVKSQS